MLDVLRITLQYCAPQHTCTYLTGLLATCRWKWFKNWAIRRLIRKYHVNLQEAASTDLADYPHFNSFFTRHLKAHLRPIAAASDAIAAPADSTVSQTGAIQQGQIFQAKGFNYSTDSLLGGAHAWAERFLHGSFTTFYLAPRDYHRVHMPIDGTLRETIYIPGRLFSVNPLTASHVPNLFARNERLVCLFDTAVGAMAVILVGAMLVGKIRVVWSDNIVSKQIERKTYTTPIALAKGAELGHFEMGSTVIVLFGENAAHWTAELTAGKIVKMGEAVGNIATCVDSNAALS